MHRLDRRQQLQHWIEQRFNLASVVLESASADASFRRYFRFHVDGVSMIAMDAPPETEDCRPFVRVAGLMAAAGLHVPRIVDQDIEQGFLVLSDLGTTSYLQALNESSADHLFRDATAALLRWQGATERDVLAPYDEKLLRRELSLFPEWYVGRHCGTVLTARQQQILEECFAVMVENSLAQPRVYVHRDYMPRNLMVCEPNPGVLDFQDAVEGPITYDLVSLFRDAFVSWDEERVLDWAARYWEKAKRAGLPVDAEFGNFYRDFEWMGLQRHLKVLGIFARLNYRDGKPDYLKDTPRFVGYVRAVASRYDAFAGLLTLLDEIGAHEPLERKN